MRKITGGLCVLLMSLFLFSCQKEASYEVGAPGKGSLQSDQGACLPKQVGGTYKVAKALADTNFIEVTVNVQQTGSYLIKTDTVNGYFFRGTGSFSATGLKTVKLTGSGTPLVDGTNNFIVSYDTSFCGVGVTVLPNTGSSGGTAAYTLQGNGAACMNSAVAGSYSQSTALTSANKVDVQVNVTAVGTWSISTPSVAGFSFAGSGTFASTGVQTITLLGTGTPTATGAQSFPVTAGSSSCSFSVTVNTNTAPQAAYTLASSAGNCSNSSVNGTYSVGTALGTANTITLQVNVTTAGQWTMTTTAVTGMTFAGSGTFATTGLQNITLNGSGSPTTQGAQNIPVSAGSSSCSVSVTVTAATPNPANNHFPLTANSWWSYNDPDGAAGDTIKRMISPTNTALAGNNYQGFLQSGMSGTVNYVFFYRKSGNDYLNYTSVDQYSIVTFDNVQRADIPILKENLTNGATWTSAEYSGQDNGVATKIKYLFTCVDANGTATINGKSYTNVYKIRFKSQTAVGTGPFVDEGLVWDAWYANNVGLIYMNGTYGTDTYSMSLRNYQVF